MHPIFRHRQMQLHYDTEYGCQQRTGWTVFIEGSCLVMFERFALVAIVKALWRARKLY